MPSSEEYNPSACVALLPLFPIPPLLVQYMSMAHGYLSQDTPAYSTAQFTPTNSFDVQIPSTRPASWHCFGDPNSYTSAPSSPSSFTNSLLSQNPIPSLSSTFQGESQDTETLNPGFELLHSDRHRHSLSSSPGSSTSDPASPLPPYLCVAPTKTGSTPPDTEVDDAPWNLVAYHIPWGSAYDGYKAGTLPGPDGTCIFLRSPTPTKRQRTSQACEKCRERKAKCSGTRPSCARCIARGHCCFYSPSSPLDPPLCASRSSSPLLIASRTPSRCRIDRPNLGGSRFLRKKRKNSTAHSERSIGNGNVSTLMSPGAEDELGSLPRGARNGSLKNRARQLRRFSSPVNHRALEIHPGFSFDTSVSASSFVRSFDSGPPSQVLSALGRSRIKAPSSLYVDSPSRLDEYRFSALPRSLESAKPVPIAHPQPQLLCHASLQAPLSFPSSNPPLYTYDASWNCPAWSGNSRPYEARNRAALVQGSMDMEVIEPLADMSSSSHLFPPCESPDPMYGYRQEGHDVSSTTFFPQPTFGLFTSPADRVPGVMSSTAFQL